MKKRKPKFVLADASLDDVNKQLKINLFIIVMGLLLFGLNALYFMQEKSFFSALLVVLIIVLLFFMAKSRDILRSKKRELSK